MREFIEFWHRSSVDKCPELLRRAYDPNSGRWLSRDPLGEEAGINLYGYVQNDPINEYDPFGLDDITLGTPGSDDYSLGVSPASNPDVPSDALTIDAHGNSQNIYTGTNNNDGKAISAQQVTVPHFFDVVFCSGLRS